MNERTNDLREFANVPFPVPHYPRPEWYLESRKVAKAKGICLYCGKKLDSKRKSYCDEGCRYAGSTMTAIGKPGISSLRSSIHQRFNFECQCCGKHLSTIMDSGVEFPMYYGEVHHVVPLEHGGKNDWNNLELLCSKCHKEKHKNRRKR